jgi:hypothetical protein
LGLSYIGLYWIDEPAGKKKAVASLGAYCTCIFYRVFLVLRQLPFIKYWEFHATFIILQGTRKTLTRYGFEEQVMTEYTRPAYAVLRERLYHNTAFHIKTTSENPTNYLVHHYNQSSEFAWSRHEFHVTADEDADICE